MEDREQILPVRNARDDLRNGLTDEHLELNASGPAITPELLALFDPFTYLRAVRKSLGDERQYTPKHEQFIRDCRVVEIRDGKSRIIEGRNLALAAVNGSGKTEILAEMIRYWLDTIPGCMVVYTAKTSQQCEALQRYLVAQQSRFPDWTLIKGRLTAANGNIARWFATDDPSNVESFHAPYLIRVLDEVKSMEDAIVDATNRWHPKMSVFVSSKGLRSGRFYECHTKNRAHWSIHEWRASDCPWMTQSFLDQVRDEVGESSTVYKSMVTNEWGDVGVRNLITLEAIERCKKQAVGWIAGKVVAGVDPSAARKNGDEFVIYYRDGNRVFPPIIIKDYSTPLEAVSASIRELKRINASVINLDKGNIGQLILPMYEEQLKGDTSLVINAVNFGAPALSHYELYQDRATEMAATLCKQIEECQLILPEDEKLVGQLTMREWAPVGAGKMKLLSKELMRVRGSHSPDRFDALMLCTQGEIPNQRSITGWNNNPFANPNWEDSEDDKNSSLSRSMDGRFDYGQ